MANYNKEWYEKNRTRLLAQYKERRKNFVENLSPEELALHKLRQSERNKANYEKNKERILKAKKKYREKNRDELVLKARERRKTSPKPTDYLKRQYGLTAQDYEKMYVSQKGVCAICEQPQKNKRLCVDHCHHTGQIRGLLCSVCNSAIGKLKDDVKLLSKAIDYLQNAKYQPDTIKS
jgi:hypothetical protein